MSTFSPSDHRRMHGFILVELMFAMSIFMGMVTFGLYLQNLESKAEQGRRVGQQYAAINTAVGNYMVTHYKALALLPVGCSTTTFRVGTSGTFNAALACELTISSTVSIANGMQPSVAELTAAGYLPQSQSGAIPGVPSLPMDMVVSEADPATGAASTTKAAGRLFINIDRVCLATHQASPSTSSAPQAPGPAGCGPTTTTSLFSLVFNTQPYTFNRSSNFGYANRIDGVRTAIGADAAMSSFTAGGPLKGVGFQIDNPVLTSAGTGLPGIVAVRNGYGANYANNHARVDGSNPPTSDWSFANNSINNVDKLSAQAVDAKVVTADVLKLGDRAEGGACDPNVENVSFENGSLLVCKSNRWTAIGNKGLISGLEYYEFVMSKESGSTMRLNQWTCPKSGCQETFAFTQVNSKYYLVTSFKKNEWQPMLVRMRDQPFGFSGLGFLTQTDYGFEVDNSGNHLFMFDTGTGLIAQGANTFMVNVIIRFYRIIP